ncbi:cytochrome P450 CYP72A616 isoform X2 [Coffea arabica]|uniref:Cytochrome P450 CYP72A616 isoform X2 n=1 Tax=Coffea arabica TaxID=13443 RepID=A0A6P6TPU1_COFAR|nr:cytochrome P450 716A67-like isoform X2 [Coffea arabica]
MEAPTLMVLVASFSALLASLCILKLVYSLWWRPKLIERELKQQGIGGTSYNFLCGDKLAIEKLMIEAWSIPVSLNHEIIPRVDPFIHQIVQTYGKVCLSWIGTRPRLILGKAELVRLILNNKSGHFQKPPQNSLVKLLALGLAALEGEKWAKHRRLITPAFHHEKLQDGKAGNADLLGLLLQCKEEKGNELTIEDVIEECKMFYFAGQETTAIWLTWTLILLSMHPAWQEKARQEVLQICGKTAPDMEILNRLKIVTMVLFEVLRLYPPATYLARYTVQRTKVGDICIPAGVEVYVPTTLLHHDPEYWGDDAEEFNPERFAEGVSKASGDQLAFYPFGWGPRICIAQNLAIIEAKLALAMILQHFSFKLSPSYAHAPCAGFTLQPQHGAPIILKPI